ncbi:MAG: hypothetical protein QM817_34725 [Archangium sp.]
MSSLVVLLSLAACGAREGATAEEEVETRSDAIINGMGRNEATFGGVLVEGASPCSGSLLAPDLVLTHARCANATQVRSAGVAIAVEISRVAPGSGGELVTLQLRKKFPSTTFVWQLTRTRVVKDEVLSCFGFDGSRVFGSGTFRVIDVSGDVISLRGGPVGLGQAFDVGVSDDGGFCIRDGNFELAATLAQKGPGARAFQVTGLQSVFADLMNAIVQARSQFAITLVDDPNKVTPNVLTLDAVRGLTSLPRVARDPRQGFYLAPTGAPDEVRLVNANTGQCLAMGFQAIAVSCDVTRSNQKFKMNYLPSFFTTGGMTDGYQFSAGLCLPTLGGSVPALPCGVLAQQLPGYDVFGMWLNQF